MHTKYKLHRKDAIAVALLDNLLDLRIHYFKQR